MEMAYRSGVADALWKPKLLPVYLFVGEEDRLKTEAVAALNARVGESEFAGFRSGDDGCRQCHRGCHSRGGWTGSLRLGAAAVVVKGVEQWRERGRQSEAEQLAAGLARLGDSACLALVVAAEEDEGKRKTAVTTKLDNAVKKIGAVVTCAALKGESLVKWIRARVRQEGKRIDAETASQLVARAGGEMLPLEQEIIKLVCYVEEREQITAQDVATVVAATPKM